MCGLAGIIRSILNDKHLTFVSFSLIFFSIFSPCLFFFYGVLHVYIAYCFSLFLIHSLNSSGRFCCPSVCLFFYISLLDNPFLFFNYLPFLVFVFYFLYPFLLAILFLSPVLPLDFSVTLVFPFLIAFPYPQVILFPFHISSSLLKLLYSHSFTLGGMLSDDCLFSF